MKLRLPVRLLAAVVAAASHVAFLTVASASGAWAVENASVDLTFVDSADAPAIVADGESLAELPFAQSAEEAVATLSDAGAEKVTAADAALPEEIAAAGDSVVVTAPMTAEDVAEVSAAPEVKTVGGANTTENVTGAKLLAEEAALVAEYNAIMPGAEGTETPAVSYPANNAAATQTAAAADLTVPETAVASDNTTTLNLSAAPAAPQTQTAALTTETVSGSTSAASVPSTASAAAPVFMTTGSEPSSAGRSAPVFLATGAAGSEVGAPVVFPTTGAGEQTFAQRHGSDLGRVQFVGDSITHGSDYGGTHNGASYRWPMHKIWTDDGISYTEVGYHVGNLNSGDYKPVFSGGSSYGGVDWENRHSAQASGRAEELIAGGNNRYEGNTPSSLAANYPTDVYFLLIGTNDTLSDYAKRGWVGGSGNPEKIYKEMMGATITTVDGVTSYSFSGDSRMDSIVGTFIANNGKNNGEVVVLSIPTWSPNHSNNNTAADFETMRVYNEILEKWCDQKGNRVTFVNTNLGIVDVANTAKPWAGVVSMFNDGLHPSGQGDLIMAGNVSKQLGYAGRSVGLSRANASATGTSWSAAASASISVAAGSSQTVVSDAFTTTLGYTVDFGVTYGNGADGGWSAFSGSSTFATDVNNNALSIQVGDGTHTGTLSFSEAYVMWGSTILYSRDNRVEGDNFRIAYVNQALDSTDNVSAGYYVWMGDMLIGEALTATTTGSDLLNGIQLSSTGASGTISNLTWADKAYAPTTTGYESEANAFKLTQVSPMPSHDNPQKQGIRSDISWTATTDKFALPSGKTESANKLYKEFSGTVGAAYTGAANANYTGDIAMRYTGTTNMDVRQSVFGVYNATVTGDVYMQFDSANTEYKSFTSGVGQQTSVTASYGGSITGSYTAVYNDGIFKFAVRGGTFTNNTIGNGSYSYVNGGTFEGGVYGGGIDGTITGGTHVVITGGVISNGVYGGGTGGTINGGTEVTITGGEITGGVYGGGTGGTINGTTNVTIEGNLASIGGDISAQYVTLKDVARNADGYSDGFDHYSGTITGVNTITLDNYTVADMGAGLVTQNLRATNGTKTTIHNLRLTACDIKADAGTSLTLADTLDLGNTTTYSGHIVIQDGVSITFGGAAGQGAYSDGKNGFMVGGTFEIFKKGADAIAETGLYNTAGQTLTSANTDTFRGAGSLNGYTFNYDAATGILTASSESGDPTNYYVNSGTVVYGGTHSAKDITTAATLTLQPTTSATLELAQNLTAKCTGGIVVAQDAQGANIKIDKDVTLAAASVHAQAGVKLQGTGTYKLAPNSIALGDYVTLADDWAGIVSVSGYSFVNNMASALNALGKTNSFVELVGTTGWAGTSTINANLILTGDAGGWAYKQDNGGDGTTLTFNGILKGSGNMGRINGKGSTYTYEFTNDISGWNGSFISRSFANHSTTFRVKDNARLVNVDMENVEGVFKLEVLTNAEFKGDVSGVTALTVAAGKTATFNGTTTFASNAASTLRGTVYNGGSMTLAGSITVNTDDLGAYELFSAGSEGFDGAAGHEGSGHLKGAGQYYLVKGTGTSTLTNNATLSGASLVTSGAPDNAVVFSATASGSSKLYYVNGNFEYSADMATNTSGYVIGAGHTLTVGSDVETVLKTSHGAGTLVVSADTTLGAAGSTAAAPYKTVLTGTLKIANDKTLQLGDHKDNDYFDMSSVENVVIGTNSTLKLQQRGMSLNNLSTSTKTDGTANTAKLYFVDTYDKDVDSLHLTGVTTIAENSTLQISSGWKNHVSIDKLTGTGILDLSKDSQQKQEQKTVNIGGIDGTLGAIRITDNYTVNFADGSTNTVTQFATGCYGNSGATVNIGADALLHITGTEVSYDDSHKMQGSFLLSHWSGTTTYNINGTLVSEAVMSSWDGTPVLNVENGGTLELHKGLTRNYSSDGRDNVNKIITVNVKEGGSLVVGNTPEGDTATHAGLAANFQDGATLSGYYGTEESAVDSVTVYQNLLLAEGASLNIATVQDKTFEVASVISGTNAGLKVNGAGTLTLSGANTYTGGTTISAGTLKATAANALGTGAVALNGGTLDVTGLSSLATTGALTLNGGTLALGGETLRLSGGLSLVGGSVDITALMTSLVASPSLMAEGDDTSNTLTLLTAASDITGNVDNIKVVGDAGAWTGATLSLDGRNLVLTMADITELTWRDVNGYWSNSAEDKNWFTPAAEQLAFTSGKDVRFGTEANGHTVTLTEAITAGNITIDEGVVVTIDDQNSKTLAGTLKGAGTYALAAGDSTLPTDVEKNDEAWIGTVKLTNVGVVDLNLNDYGHTGSKVELDGVTKHFLNANQTFNPTMVLSGEGLTITDAYSNKTYTFAGGVSGAGSFKTNIGTSATNQTYKFTGDVSGWTGAFESLKADKTTTLVFADAANKMNAAITNTAGTINLQTENDVTFNKAVSVSQTTVKGAHTVTFAGGEASLGVISLAGNNTDDATKLRFSVNPDTGAGSYTASTIEMSSNGNTGLKWVVVDNGAEFHLTGTNVGTGGGSSIINGWGIRGGGLDVDGTLIADGVISFDGPSSSTVRGGGLVKAAGLNVSNGNTTTLQGGVTVDITSSQGVYRRAGEDSTLNLADVTLAANSADWVLMNSITNVNLTSAAGTTFSAAADHTITVNKTMGGVGKLVKDGEGTVKLMTANNYTGGTEIKRGTLVAGNTTALNTGAVSIADGATLEAAVDTVTVAGALSGEGSVTYTGTSAGTVNLNGSVADYTGTFTNKSAQDVTLNLPGGTGRDIKFDIDRAANAGKVNMNLQDTNKDYYLRGTANVNNISHAVNVSLLLKDAADVTATGTVRTGRLVVGEASTETDARFTLSGSSAMLNKENGSHEYNAAVQGYGTFAVANGATENLTGTLTGFHGTFEASGANSVLTLGSALASDTDLLATGGGKIELTSSARTADTVTIGSGSTLKLGGYGDNALTVGHLSLANGSVLDLTGLSFTGSGDVVLMHGGTVHESNVGTVNLLGVAEGSSVVVKDNNLVLTFVPADDYIWTGGDGAWTDPNWHKAATPKTQTDYSDYSNVVFKTGESTITLTGDVHAPKTTLQKGAVLRVERDGNTLTTALDGPGTFVLDTNSVSLPSGVTLADTWDGIVRLTSTEDKKNVDLRPLVTEDSWIEFNGFTGYTNSWATSAGGGYNIPLSQNIILTDTEDGQPAWIWTAMGSNPDSLYEGYQCYVTGDWAGNGTLAVKYPTSRTSGNTSAQSFRFSGDISEWDGKITVHKNSAALTNIGLYFEGESTQVNVDIEKPRGQVFVHVGNGTAAFDTSFNGTVDATSFEVKANATATITGQTRTETLYGNGNLIVTGGDMAVSGASTIKGTTTVQSGELLLNGGGDMGGVVVTGGNFTTTGAENISLDSLAVTGGAAHVGNSGTADLGAITLGGDGSLVLNTTVSADSLTTTGGTLTFAGAGMLTTTGGINLGEGTTFDMSKITYRADQAEQRIVLGTSSSGSITLGSTDAYTFINSKYDSATYSLEQSGNDLVLVVNMEVGDWPTDSKVRYTYTNTSGHEEIHYDNATSTSSAHGYAFNKGDGGIVSFNPNLFTDANNHTYTDETSRILLNTDTTFIVEEGNTVKFEGRLEGNNKQGTGHSGMLIKQGGGTLEMAINSDTLNSSSNPQNAYEGSVEVLDGTLHVVAQATKGQESHNTSSLAASNGAYVRVAKDATLLMDEDVEIGIPKGHRNYKKEGDDVSLVLQTAGGQQATITNAYINQQGIRVDDSADGGRASLTGISVTLTDGSLSGNPISVTMADMVCTDFGMMGHVTVDDSHIQANGELLFYKWGEEEIESEVRVQNNSLIEFSGYMALVKDSIIDKTSKIQNIGNKEDQMVAALIGHNSVEVACVEQGGVATRDINDVERTITYSSDQYKGFTLGNDWVTFPLSLSITLSDMDMPEDLTGYTFTLTMEGLNSSALLSSDFTSLSGLDVELLMPQYTGSAWETMVANVQAKYDGTNTVFMFQDVVVPEPTTSTLSLLALAALCARRRRKA